MAQVSDADDEEAGMLPKVVLHKRNGHQRSPGTRDLSPAEMLCLVHSIREDAPPPTYDLLKFAGVVRSEHVASFVEQAMTEIDGLRSSLAESLARTRVAFGDGEMTDVRADLDALKARAARAERVLRNLVSVLDAEPGANPTLVDLDALVEATLALDRFHDDPEVHVERHVGERLPLVVGNRVMLERVLAIVVGAAWTAAGLGGAPATVAVETSQESVMRGEAVVRLRVTARGSLEPVHATPAVDLALARRIVMDHGGRFAVEDAGDGSARFTLEFPGA
jgi:signal transduction histidine kinase